MVRIRAGASENRFEKGYPHKAVRLEKQKALGLLKNRSVQMALTLASHRAEHHARDPGVR
jgi:hypothetical protein